MTDRRPFIDSRLGGTWSPIINSSSVKSINGVGLSFALKVFALQTIVQSSQAIQRSFQNSTLGLPSLPQVYTSVVLF